MSLVIDASVVIAWALPGESSAIADAAMEEAFNSGLNVPAHWHIEVGNVLLRCERKRLISPQEAEITRRSLSQIALVLDLETQARAWTEADGLARRHNLTLYDATYLELAIRRGVPLATLDGGLSAAASIELVAWQANA